MSDQDFPPQYPGSRWPNTNLGGAQGIVRGLPRSDIIPDPPNPEGNPPPTPQFGGGMFGPPLGPQAWEIRESVCAEADRLTSTERGHNYGPPIDDFGKVVGMAQALWGRGPETEEEHALYMILVKLSRLANNPGHRDSLVDIAGYSKTYEMILDARKKDLKDGGFA